LDVARNKAIGNAIVPEVAFRIFQAIEEVQADIRFRKRQQQPLAA